MAQAPQQFCVRWNSYHTNLQTVFPRLLLSEQFADVTLASEGRQVRCHKLVLSASSGYLEQLLLSNPCKHPIVLMKDMRFSELQALVDFMYKGEVNVTQDELPSLLKSAEALQIRGQTPQPPTKPSNGAGKKRTPDSAVKEELVEEDGLFYGELDNDQMDYHEDEDSGKPGSSLGQPSARSFLRVKPESELFFQNKLQSLAKNNSDYIAKLAKMNPAQIHNEFSKYGFSTTEEINAKKQQTSDNDYYKSWLEQNGELEVSLLKASDRKKPKPETKTGKSEVELIPKNKSAIDKALSSEYPKAELFPQIRRRGRPPIFKDRNVDIGETVLKSDLDQFLEGKEISSSGLSRKDLERVMMGKFNPNRRYSNEAMWAALMDVKKGGSIYRAAQTHKVPRKSLRNWMKRCHIKSSFPMPQQLKQFVENSKKQKEFKNFEYPQTETEPKMADTETEMANFEPDIDFGKHFLFSNSNQVSSEDDAGDKSDDDKEVTPVSSEKNDTPDAVDMSVNE
ncbi:uncharacterized protein LOC105395183 [Plutella xylostella]|uniref:uncharacterized protein LOC105395183 n=1 Tax=Plutella xylostella TaxID=51655 RepID=UPI002033077E|nr:uncharacterized protein LOC105395183 [Plutella xylostella]